MGVFFTLAAHDVEQFLHECLWVVDKIDGHEIFVSGLDLFLSKSSGCFSFSFSSVFSLAFVCLAIPFLALRSSGLTTSSSLSGNSSRGMVVSIRKWQAMSLILVDGAKQD